MSYLSHSSHDTELLCTDETLEHDSDSHVHIVLIHVISQVHLSMTLRHSDH